MASLENSTSARNTEKAKHAYREWKGETNARKRFAMRRLFDVIHGVTENGYPVITTVHKPTGVVVHREVVVNHVVDGGRRRTRRSRKRSTRPRRKTHRRRH